MMGSLSIFILFCKNGKDSAVNTRLVGILIDSFPKILINGLTVTLPLTIISFALALVIALITALVQTAKIPVLRQLAGFMSGSSAAPRCWYSCSWCFTACPALAY